MWFLRIAEELANVVPANLSMWFLRIAEVPANRRAI